MEEVIASTYRIIKKLGSGGGGNVYLADHLRLNKKVVLKADKRRSSTKTSLLRREADVLKNLNHPNIPKVYDFFMENDTVYTVMDYIEGESLDRPLKRGEHFSQPQVIQWAKELLDALNYLHSPTHGDPPRGFVHSDIKPANLMRTPDNHIVLIDFNIALSLGEDAVIGCSAGYASPEHYGLDFSSDSDTVHGDSETEAESWSAADGETEVDEPTIERTIAESDTGETEVEEESGKERSFSSSPKKMIVPDVRSDIYSTGATLYHLLSGSKPAKNAKAVVSLSEKEYSPQVVKIIRKAMNPNPDLRYQTARDMRSDFLHLRDRDPRVRRLKAVKRLDIGVVLLLLAAGASMTFVGLKRMQTTENWLKLAEYSKSALESGDVDEAVKDALTGLPEEKGILIPGWLPESRRALTSALGVYDLSDKFRSSGVVKLPSAPYKIKMSPDGKKIAAVYQSEAAVYDAESLEQLMTCPMTDSALADALFSDDSHLLAAAKDGVSLYDIESGEQIWKTGMASTLAISGDGQTVAAMNRDRNIVSFYDMKDGQLLRERSLGEKQMASAFNDSFADPDNAIFSLNMDGTMLAVSFSDGGLYVMDTEHPEDDLIVYENSDYTEFAGGFHGDKFVFSAGKSGHSIFGLVNVDEGTYIGDMESNLQMKAKADESGIWVSEGNLLSEFDPDTLDDKEIAFTDTWNISNFSVSDQHVLAVTDEPGFSIFDQGENALVHEKSDEEYSFAELGIEYAVLANRSQPEVRVMKEETHEDTCVVRYDAKYSHDEARVTGDGKKAMLFSYAGFRIYDNDGTLAAEGSFPEAEKIYDQQFRRDGEKSWLDVIWYDGMVRAYSAEDGTLISEESGEAPSKDLEEEFSTEKYRFVSELHSAPKVYDRQSGKFVKELEKDDFLAYVTEIGEYILTEYVRADGERYGLLLDQNLEILADLPDLCDIDAADRTLYFDYKNGELRKCHLYSIQELIDLGKNYR